MSSLDKIQKLSKLGKILCSIVFVFCVIGIIGSVVGIAFLAAGVDAIHIEGVTLKSIVQTNSGTSIGTANIYMVVAIILCSGEAVIAKFAEHYFKGELLDGTPFNMERAKELTRLGIITIGVSIVTEMVAAIVYEIMSFIFVNTDSLEIGNWGSVGIGITFIIVSLICRYGAERGREQQNFDYILRQMNLYDYYEKTIEPFKSLSDIDDNEADRIIHT